MTAAIQVDIDVVQRGVFRMQVTWADATTDPPTPIPLTGYHARMQIRTKPGVTGNAIVDLSSIGSNPALTIEPLGATGVVDVRIGGDQTALLTKTSAYDLFVIKDSDPTEAVRLVYGAVNVSKSVTIYT